MRLRALSFLAFSLFIFNATAIAQTSPTISYTTPVNGPVGTSITIVGNNFGSSQGSSTVTFNSTLATPTSWSNTQVVAPIPSGATTGPIIVTVAGVASNGMSFTVGTPPTISWTSPVNGPVGTSVKIVGNYFGATQAASTITFNGVATTPTSWSNTQVVAPVPAGTTTGPIVITVGGVTSNRMNFTVGTPPTISYTNPFVGPVGTSVTIVGNYFGSTQGSSTVTFNGVAATPASWSNTQIVAPVPSGASTGPVVLSVGGINSNRSNFTVGTPPTISYTNPFVGPVGTSVNIVGNYFGTTTGTVTFNGVAATPASWTNTQITVPVPNGASTGPLIVSAGGMSSNTVNFTVGTPPTISYTNPVSAPVGGSVTVVGNYFGSTPGVITFNGVAGSPASWTDTQIVVPVPAGASSGPLVATVGGTSGNSVNFTVLTTPPTITASASPAANAAGWNNSSVVLTYSCTPGGASIPSSACPSPQTVSSEGANQQITATVTDSAGVTGSVTTTLNIDKTPPALALGSPIAGSIVASSPLTLTGTASDALSGLSAITCNGTSAQLVPDHPGRREHAHRPNPAIHRQR